MRVIDVLTIALAFLLGSLPFSYWVGTLFLHIDIRTIADGNPGAANVFRTGHTGLGILAMVLDFLKGFVPVYLWWNPESTLLGIGLALAPVLGHAFSPFLQGRGGKAVAVTFGVWTALTMGVAAMTMGAVFLFTTLVISVKHDGWRVIMGMASVFLALLGMQAPPSYFTILLLNFLIVVYKHREDLKQPIRVAPGERKWL